MPTVNMPNGDPVNFPDDMPPDHIKMLIAQKFPTETQAHINQPQGPGFFDRVGQDYKDRLAEGQQAIDAEKAGRQGGGFTALDYLGKVGFGTLTDVGGEALKSAADVLPQGVKDAASSGLHYLATTPPGRAAVGSAQYLGPKYQDFAQRYPDAARHVEAAANIGGVLAPEVPFKGTSLAGAAVDAAKTTGTFLKNVGTDLVRAPEAKTAVTVAKDTVPVSKDWWKELDAVSGGLPSGQVNNLSRNVNALRPSDPAEAAVWDKSGIQKNIDTVNSALSQGTLTYKGAKALRSDVNSDIKMAYRADDETKARQLMQIKEKLTNALTNPDTASQMDVKSSNAWKMANHESAKEFLLDDLELVAAKAAGKAQPANSLDTALNNFLHGNASAGLRPEERAALEDVTKKTQTGELLKASAGRLIPQIGAAVGGPVGFLAGHYGSMLSRNTAEALKLRKLDKVYELIKSRAAPSLAEYKPPLSLPAPGNGTSFFVDNLGNVSRTPNPAMEITKSRTSDIRGTPVEPQNANTVPLKLLPSPDKMSALPLSSAEITRQNAEAMARNAARGNTEQPFLSGEPIPMRPYNQTTIGAKGNLGTQLIQQIQEMGAQGKSPQEIDQFIRSVLKNRKK